MKPSYNYSWSLSQAPEGPLAPYIDYFIGLLRNQGYAPDSAHMKVRLTVDFSHWLKQQAIALHAITAEHVTLYLQYRAHHQRPRSDDTFTLKQLLSLLQQKGAIAEEEEPGEITPIGQLTGEFTLYLRQDRGLAPVTIDLYVFFIQRFLAACFDNEKSLHLSQLCAADIVGFVQDQAKCLHQKRAKVMTTALRSFLRYVRYRGDIKLDLAAAVPTVANGSMTSIPRAISAEHVQAILTSCNRHTAVGCRDYAILLLLARLGLRASEIVALTLEDIDWEAGFLKLSGKRGEACPLPLPAEVGEAIATYLQEGRPHSTSRRVFLRCKAPIRGFKSSSAIGSIVRHSLERAAIDLPRKGAHQFRHGLACELLRQGASLAEIGELLRHRSPKTTALYAKVDLVALRTLALPWPGGVQ
jgi:site-specific recombinase XerD